MTKLTQQFPFPVSKAPLPDVVEDSAPWVAEETATCDFQDARLSRRLRALLGQLANGVGAPIPFACQDWANTNAAYRFLSNEKVNEATILAGHFQSTASRFAACSGPVLVLQDTTALTYYRNNPKAIGEPYKAIVKNGVTRKQTKSMCGILMHSSLAVTAQGVPLGLAAIKFWSRRRYKGCNALKRKVNPTRVPIQQKESFRWLENLRQSTRLFADPKRCVHVGDRESDIYELFCTACELKTHFLVRTCVDRLAGDGQHTITTEMEEVRVKGPHHVEVIDSKGKPVWATLELRYRRVHVLPPIGKQKDYPALTLTVLHARERGTPQGRKPIDWKLITDLPVSSRSEAIEKLHWYAQRWKIETFHKILKSGCRAEDAKLRTADRLANLVSILCIVSWRIFWMTMMNRALPDVPATLALTQTEAGLLDRLVVDKRNAVGSGDLSHYLNKIARLGGYLDRAHDAPPGNTVMWRGLTRLIYIELGFNIGTELMGN